MDLNPDFRDMLLALNDADVDYMVVGAYAVAAHGYPRATGDIDIWVRTDSETAPKIMKALIAFGAPMQEISESDFTSPSVVFQIGVPPGRIDILTVLSGVGFSSACLWSELEPDLDGFPSPDWHGDVLKERLANPSVEPPLALDEAMARIKERVHVSKNQGGS